MIFHGLEKRVRKWCFMDLVTDPTTGRLAESKLWSNGGKAGVLFFYCKFVSATNFETMTLVMLGALIGHAVVATNMSIKREASQQPQSGTVETTSSSTSTKVTP